jgi:DNA-binding response OmpR family regulator
MRTLLIIDDDPAWRSLYRLMFAGKFRVFEATDGHEGLARYEETSPDLVIVDLRMPRMDGTTFVAKVRGKNHVAPVIVCTAVSREAAALVGSGVHVVPKSPGLKELLNVVSSLDSERPGRCDAEAGRENRD